MQYYSTKNKTILVSFQEAVLKGISDDGGLFMPVEFPRLPVEFFRQNENITFLDIASTVSQHFVGRDIPKTDLHLILEDAFDFEVPLKRLNEKISILELFHGPTLAFKDFGARFMARTIAYLNRHQTKETTILVATSGDTGSAVASGFYNQPGIRVILLYPSGMVSEIQEKQLTTFSGNVVALEVLGTFDDCQSLVKTAFMDADLKNNLKLSSANSINIARLIPQSFYYLFAYLQLQQKQLPVIFSVPSGNLGNLTAGLFAREMGLPAFRFIAALNVNDVFLNYLEIGFFQPKKAIPTISNAMDVGNPSNFERILALYQKDHQVIKSIIFSQSFSDKQTRRAIGEIYSRFKYIMDPHGAIGYLALQDFILDQKISDFHGIILETAHPAKFGTAVEEVLLKKVSVPKKLQKCLRNEKKSMKISKNFNEFKEFLLGTQK
jgi:threonine synthase